jgi:hypothetical protein
LPVVIGAIDRARAGRFINRRNIMFAMKSLALAAVLTAGAALPSTAPAQQVGVVIEAPAVQYEPVRWRRSYYYRPNGYYRPYVNRPYVATYPYYNYSYRPYWRGYYNYGPRAYYW